MTKEKIVPVSAEEFKDEKTGNYVFPFDVLDKTPGGSNLGRIQWVVEMHPAKKEEDETYLRVGKLWVWAKQTRDPRYMQKVFEIETFAECITTDASLHRDKAFAPWMILFCAEHPGAVIMDCYPENGSKELIINTFSSISVELNFR